MKTEKSQFAEYIISEHKTKEDILGDKSIVDELESIVGNFVSGKKHENFILISGPARSGKTTLIDYLGSYASEVAEKQGVDLSVVSLDLKSVYKDGAEIKLQAQVDEIRSNKNRRYLIIQDELEGNHSSFFSLLTDNSLENYLLIGSSNWLARVSDRLKDRSKVVDWKGARYLE